ncbi:PAM68 family protein [Leptolyngbya sp. NK1-12]|uniref:PAM68 family protein n=1 Tax=Leptolyngbya sp. NK1-12 TaxID=2547451 RepID=A0AA97AI52_9CYAN|nr:PAM68 family protein [Leptolyngbya sp. NK1-12]WNZ23461.1 PAM68 family protein [Leptolyngbya sp. NK1-12]
MSAKPKPDASKGSSDASKRKAMPFEPRSTQTEKQNEKKSGKPAGQSASATKSNRTSKSKPKVRTEGIPEVVSRRMVKRVALFCGIPTALGMSTFIVSYLVVSNDWLQLPTYAVLLVSLLWFGLGVLGVSYGVLSASWDEDRAGSWLGFSEFRTNWGRMTEAWRANKKQE